MSTWFLIYKTVVTGYFVGYYSWNHIQKTRSSEPSKYWIYLTDWGYEIIVWTVILTYVLVVARYISEFWFEDDFKAENRKPFLHETNHFGNQLLWFMTSVSYTMAASITIAFWSILYPLSGPPPTVETKVENFSVHLVQVYFRSLKGLFQDFFKQGCFVIADTLICSTPWRIPHVWAPATFGLIYCFFNIGYVLGGGTDPDGHHFIYPITPWQDNPGLATGTSFAVLVLLIAVHYGLWGLSFLRDKLWMRLFKVTQNEKVEFEMSKSWRSHPSNYGATDQTTASHV